MNPAISRKRVTGSGLLVLVHEQVGAHGAVRMRGQGRDLLAAQRAHEARERRHAGEREPVLVDVADAGLVVDAVRHVRHGEPLGFEFVARDAAREAHRLEADGADHVDVLERQPDDVADLVVVQALDDGRDEADLHAGLAHVLDGLHLLFEQRFAARPHVGVVADAVELKVQGVQPGLFRLHGEFEVGEHDAVGGCLQVREAHLLGHPERFEEVRVDGRLAARELHDAVGHRRLRCAAPRACGRTWSRLGS